MIDVEKQIEEAIDALVLAAFVEGGCSEHRTSEARIQTELRKKELRTLLSSAQSGQLKHATAHDIIQAIRSLQRYSVGKDKKGEMHTFAIQDGPFLRAHEVISAIDAAISPKTNGEAV